ncbi:hypothetical protein D0862_15024 [Hortaea werneckii]|uniref:Large ribosomal subunit protein mL40 n=1 Tax=Hortaea werneckii TaxID=91943 RepID=A0A3M7DUL2_HORWE|nr:hypothetical protein D0862_15024 [Hortaea werneckii]
MKAPSTALLRTFSPLWQSQPTPWTARSCIQRLPQQQPQCANFSTTRSNLARKGRGGEKRDMRITLIRYHLQHPLTPRPLRFSRNRSLRHWTIHRAWRLYQSRLQLARERELERQYNSMAAACEALRLIDNHGLTTEERGKLGAAAATDDHPGKEMGRLFRIAMRKDDVWDGVPIEYARIQTETPPREGFNEGWTR